MAADSENKARTSRRSAFLSGLSRAEGLLVAILLVAIVFKVSYLRSYVLTSPFYLVPASDSEVYLLRAAEIARDGLIGNEVYYRAPLYPLLLYGVLSWSDFDPLPVLMLQLAMGIGILVLIYLTTARVSSKRGGILAVLLALGYAPLTFYETKILATIPGVFLGMLFLYLLVRAEQNRRIVHWILGALALGLAIICRPHYLLVLPLAVAGLAWRYRDDFASIRAPLTVLAGVAAAVIAIVSIRNYYVSGDLVLISANAGTTFAQGNAPGARGSLTAIAGLSNEVITQHVSARQLAEQEVGRALSPAEVNSYWFRYGLQAIVQRPDRYLTLLFRKTALILNNRELGSCYLVDIDRQMFPILRLAVVPFGFILACCAVGILTLRRELPIPVILLAALVGTVLIMLMFYVTTRYRMALVPVAVVFAGAGIDRFLAGLPDRKQTALSLAVAVSVVLLSTSPMLPMSQRELSDGDAGFWGELSLAYRMQQRRAESRQALREAIELAPQVAEFQLRDFDLRRSDFAGAEEQLREAKSLVRTFPDAAGAYTRTGDAQLQLGMSEEAIRSYQQAISRDPTNAAAWLGIGTAFLRIGEAEMAYKSLSQGLQQQPTDRQMQLQFARACVETGQYEEARQWVQRVLAANSDDQQARQLYAKLQQADDEATRQ